MIPNNVCTLCVTAAAGTELAGASSRAYVNAGAINAYPFMTRDSSLQPKGLRPTRGVAPSDLRPLRKILDYSLP